MMISVSFDEDATPRCSGGQGGRLSEQAGDAARSCLEYGEPRGGRANVAQQAQRPFWGAALPSGKMERGPY
jgi:hypothetical protein